MEIKGNVYCFSSDEFNNQGNLAIKIPYEEKYKNKTKFIFNFNDGTTAQYDNFEGLQNFLDRVQKYHDIEKKMQELNEENKELKKLLRESKKPVKYFIEVYKGKLVGAGRAVYSEKKQAEYKKLLSDIEEILR